jgi:nucleotidyltransferase/DNA polymerase involved in DNA repair
MRILALVWPDLRGPDAAAHLAAWEPMLDALDDLSPRIEPVDVGVALVDVTGLAPTWGTERRIAARAVVLARAVTPVSVRCGIGDNRWLATLAARLARPERPDAPAALRILERAELADLPLSLLPADPATHARFALFGLSAMRQLAELPRSAVGAQFGSAGERLQALARGHDPRPLVPRRRPERVEAGATFDPPLDGVGAVGLTLRRLASELCERLADRHLAPGRAALALDLEDAPALRVAQPFPQPTLEPDWIARLLLSRIEAAARARTRSCRPAEPTEKERSNSGAGWPPVADDGISRSRSGPKLAVSSAGEQLARFAEERQQLVADLDEPRVASVRLTFDRLADPTARQLPVFEAQAGRWEELRWSLERIGHRFGTGRLWRAEVHRPHASLPEHRARVVDIGA